MQHGLALRSLLPRGVSVLDVLYGGELSAWKIQ